MRILLVEPDRILANVYANACRKRDKDVEVTNVASVEDAIRAVDNQSFDLIITELLLAQHNGIEFLYELRSYTDLQSIPIIVLSWIPEQEFYSAIDARLFTIREYLYKPTTTLLQLTSAVQKIAAKARTS